MLFCCLTFLFLNGRRDWVRYLDPSPTFVCLVLMLILLIQYTCICIYICFHICLRIAFVIVSLLLSQYAWRERRYFRNVLPPGKQDSYFQRRVVLSTPLKQIQIFFWCLLIQSQPCNQKQRGLDGIQWMIFPECLLLSVVLLRVCFFRTCVLCTFSCESVLGFKFIQFLLISALSDTFWRQGKEKIGWCHRWP